MRPEGVEPADGRVFRVLPQGGAEPGHLRPQGRPLRVVQAADGGGEALLQLLDAQEHLGGLGRHHVGERVGFFLGRSALPHRHGRRVPGRARAVAAGVAVAALGYFLLRAISSTIIINTTLLLIPFVAFLLAELIGASGVLAVVAGAETISAKIPGALIGLVAATVAVIAAGLESKGVAVEDGTGMQGGDFKAGEVRVAAGEVGQPGNHGFGLRPAAGPQQDADEDGHVGVHPGTRRRHRPEGQHRYNHQGAPGDHFSSQPLVPASDNASSIST